MIHHKIHHHAKKVVHHLRQKPHHEREHIARLTAITVTAALLIGWGILFMGTVKNDVASIKVPTLPEQKAQAASADAANAALTTDIVTQVVDPTPSMGSGQAGSPQAATGTSQNVIQIQQIQSP